MTARFDKFFNHLLGAEGGYVNNKNDKGGATNYGVTQVVYDSYRKVRKLNPNPVKNITLDEAKNIYLINYYATIKAEAIPDEAVAYILFDLAVNSGCGTANKIRKEVGDNACDLLTRRAELYNNIVAGNPSQKVFLKGWLARLNNVAKFLGVEWSCELQN
jgi:lysozyme family protein